MNRIVKSEKAALREAARYTSWISLAGSVIFLLIIAIICPYYVLINILIFGGYAIEDLKRRVLKKIAGQALYIGGVILMVFGSLLFVLHINIGMSSIVPAFIDTILRSILPDILVAEQFGLSKDILVKLGISIIILIYAGIFVIDGTHLANVGRTLLASTRTINLELPLFLFLRPFHSDLVTHGLGNLDGQRLDHGILNDFKEFEKQKPHASFSSHFRRNTRDRLNHSLRRLGNLEMIQNPSDDGIAPGPYQTRVEDDNNWQLEVISRIHDASAAFIHIGVTEGLLWEVKQVIMTMDPTQVFLYIPLTRFDQHIEIIRAEYDSFRSLTVGVFPKSLPEYKKGVEFIYFDKDWTPHMLIPIWPGLRIRWPWRTKVELPQQDQILHALSAEFAPSSRRNSIEIAVIIIIFFLLLLLLEWLFKLQLIFVD